MPDVTATRFVRDRETGDVIGDVDALLAVEIGDPEVERGINLHVSPRDEDVVTCSLSAAEAWALARELARAASEMEAERGV